MTEMIGTATPAEAGTVTVAAAEIAADACDVCGHPMARHDRIAARFCSATQAGALSRSCICPS